MLTTTYIISLAGAKVVLDKATCPEDVFGSDIKGRYRQLVLACHPDRAGDAATDTFQKLELFKSQADLKVTLGTYGDRKPVKPPKPPYVSSTFTLPHETITLTSEIGRGPIAVVHAASSTKDRPQSLFVKIAKRPSNNAMLDREYKNLNEIVRQSKDPTRETFFKIQRPYVPLPLRTFQLKGDGGKGFRATLFGIPSGDDRLSIKEILEKQTDGLPLDHVYWIFRRTLLTIWMAHLRGFVHGGLTPDHVVVYPEAHGLMVIDWTASAQIGKEYVKTVDPQWQTSFFAPEIFKLQICAPSIDIYGATQTAIYLGGGFDIMSAKAPKPVLNLLSTCLRVEPERRPQDAERLYAEFGALIEQIHGPRKFARLEI